MSRLFFAMVDSPFGAVLGEKEGAAIIIGIGWACLPTGSERRRGECHDGAWHSPWRPGISNALRCSGGAATAGGQLAHVVEEDGALEGVELRSVSRNFGEE